LEILNILVIKHDSNLLNLSLITWILDPRSFSHTVSKEYCYNCFEIYLSYLRCFVQFSLLLLTQFLLLFRSSSFELRSFF
jgi:hypothetical protein